MHLRMLARQKAVLLLLITTPALFLVIVQFTASRNNIFFQLNITESTAVTRAKSVELSSVFVSMAVIGFLSSFVALSLVQQFKNANRRLVICGYRPAELVFSSITVLLLVILLLSVIVGSCILFFFKPLHFWLMVTGMFLTGAVYGGYGLLVGNLVQSDLEGTLMIILLANIDAGWLQNPLFFPGARNKLLIQLLPAHNSSQVAITAAFSNAPFGHAIVLGLAYSICFFVAAVYVAYRR